MPRKLTQDEFINRAKLIHDNKYDYRYADYKDNESKLKIICPIHGLFEQSANNHCNKGSGCPRCGGTEKRTTEEFVTKARLTHGDKYDYSLVEYKNKKVKIKIICPIHGLFKQRPENHLFGKGCPKCCKNGILNTTEEFVTKARLTHGDKYDYSLVEYKNSKIKIKIICKIHGIFKVTPNQHLMMVGCPLCNSSRGELKIKKFFEDNKIIFNPQHKFDGCKHKRKLPFDFFLPEYNLCIEYQGRQHFEQVQNWDFNAIQVTDKLKKDYCALKGIRLLEITYKDDPIKVLKEFLCENSPNPLSAKDLLESP